MQPVTTTRPWADAAVLGDGLADRLEAFFLGAVEEAAGVDQHDIGAGIVGRHFIAVGAQLGEDALGIDQRLGAAERDHADARRGGKDFGHSGSRGDIATFQAKRRR
jgi:hypothetical protein